MKLTSKTILTRIKLPMAIASGIAVFLAYLVGAYITGSFHESSKYLGAMLAAISSIVVLQDDFKTSLNQGAYRVLGTFIGALVAYLYLIWFNFSLIGMVIVVGILNLVCTTLAIPDNGRMATITLVVVISISINDPDIPPLVNGVLRFVEAAVGVSIGVALVWLLHFSTNKGKK